MTAYTFSECNWVFAIRGGCWILGWWKYDISKIDYSDKFYVECPVKEKLSYAKIEGWVKSLIPTENSNNNLY